MTAWIEVLTALTAGPDLPLRGTIHGVHAEGVSESFTGGFAYSGQPPMMVVPGHGCRVWRHGNKIRVENIDGEPVFISDGVRAWDFTDRSDRPLVGSPDRVIYLGPNQFLLHRRSAARMGRKRLRPACRGSGSYQVRWTGLLDSATRATGRQAVSAPDLGRC